MDQQLRLEIVYENNLDTDKFARMFNNKAQSYKLHNEKRDISDDIRHLKSKIESTYSEVESIRSDIDSLKAQRSSWNNKRKSIQNLLWENSISLMWIGNGDQQDDDVAVRIRTMT